MRASILLSSLLMLAASTALARDPSVGDVQRINELLQSVTQSTQPTKTSCTATNVFQVPQPHSGLCDDLARFACAPGAYSDGTGSGGSSSISNQGEEVRLRAQSQFMKTFRQALGDPANTYFRNLSLSALGLTHAPACEGGDQEICDSSAAQGLAEIATKRIFGGFNPGSNATTPEARDLDLLLRNPVYQKAESDLYGYIRPQLEDKALIQTIQSTVFPEIKAMIEKVIEKKISQRRLRRELLAKVSAIRFEGNSCDQLSPGAPPISALLAPAAYYDPSSNTFRYCNGLLMVNQSRFMIAAVIAHELSHSIDPCSITNGPRDFTFQYSNPADPAQSAKEYPFSGLISCFRSSQSVMAVNVGAMPNKNSPFCMDQIVETFADWMATQVVPTYIQTHYHLTAEQYRIGYSNVFRGMCDNTDPGTSSDATMPNDLHPNLQKRADRIWLVNPEVRKQMGCPLAPPEGSQYCSIQKEGAK